MNVSIDFIRDKGPMLMTIGLRTSRSLHVLLKSLILIRFHGPEILV